DRAAFERARNIDAIIFDKTGTLTKGEFGVTDILSFSKEINESELLKYAASLEAQSSHPIAKAITKATDDRYEVAKFKSITGKGAEGIVNGKDIKIVSPGYLKENNIVIKNHNNIDMLASQGISTVLFPEVILCASLGISLASWVRALEAPIIDFISIQWPRSITTIRVASSQKKNFPSSPNTTALL
ncbi:unnamed protein product, partial [marine sediment metagenome]